jgi:hypothetical protein
MRRASLVTGTGPGATGEGRGSYFPSTIRQILRPPLVQVLALHSLQCSPATVAGTKSRAQNELSDFHQKTP